MADNNPFFISTEGTGITFGQIDDLVDFPHSGIIKALNQMSRGNFAVKGANNFNITQSSSDPIISVATGTYFRDGKQFTTSQAYTFNAAAFTATSDNSYYLIVVDSSNVVRLRVPTATNRVAQFTLGDTIIALLEYSSSSSNGARRVQFFTTDKVSNDLSIGHNDSGYTESLSISSNAGDTTIENKVSNKDIIFKVLDGSTVTEVLRLDGSTGNVGIGLAHNVTAEEKLDVEDGNISLTTTARQTERVIKLRNSGSTTSLSEIAFAGANTNNFEGYIAFKTKGPSDLYDQPLNEIMRVDGNGNVGIGTNAPTEKLHLSDADGTEPSILIENTGTSANEPELVFWRSTGTGADSRDIGHIKFKADDTAGNLHTFANLFADSEDADTTTEDGRLLFYVTKGGTDGVEQLRISGSSGIIFNEGGADIDVRIEGDTDANLFFTDAGEDKIGIGTSSPTAKLHVAGDAIVTGGLTMGAGANEFTITESSDDITLANTVNDKDIDISVKNGDGTAKRAKFTADTHSGEIILAGVEEVIIVALSDETTNLATGTAKASFHMPYAMTLSKVKASVNTAPTGSVLTVDINEAGTTILSTKLTIDAGEFTSDTAATAAVISDAALADNALITFDIDGVGSSATGKGLKVTLYGKRP